MVYILPVSAKKVNTGTVDNGKQPGGEPGLVPEIFDTQKNLDEHFLRQILTGILLPDIASALFKDFLLMSLCQCRKITLISAFLQLQRQRFITHALNIRHNCLQK